jgi:uracil-DNA glycosylase
VNSPFDQTIREVKNCKLCEPDLPLGANPVFSISPLSRILIIGQAPGTKVHESGIPWNDPSGVQLRKWLDVSEADFYNADTFGIVPMGLCYPGKGKSGDLPPRKECAPAWHQTLLQLMPNLRLSILIGQYAQKYYLKDRLKNSLTETVKSFELYLPNYAVLPHPSPRNRFWLSKNPWFETDIIPKLRAKVQSLMSD